MLGKKTNQIQDEWTTSRNGIQLNLWFAFFLVVWFHTLLVGRDTINIPKIILSVHAFIIRTLIIALRNNTVCFGVLMPGSLQTEPAWLTRPVWLIGPLRPVVLATFPHCKLRLFVARITTSAHNKFSQKCCPYCWALRGQWAKLAWLAMLVQFAEILYKHTSHTLQLQKKILVQLAGILVRQCWDPR